MISIFTISTFNLKISIILFKLPFFCYFCIVKHKRIQTMRISLYQLINMFVTGSNGKYGFIDKSRRLVIPCQWKWLAFSTMMMACAG